MKYILELEDEPNESYFGEGNFYRCKQIPYWSISESMRNRLEPYDEANRKTENSSEKPNNCEYDEYWKHLFIEVVKGHMSDAAANQAWYEYINHKDEPTSSKMEQVDKDINVRSKTEPQTEREGE